MTLPTYENLKTLDYANDGCPFCNVGAADCVDLNGLDFAFQGEPFSGTIGSSGSSSTVVVNAMAAVAKISGGIAGIVSPIFIVLAAASVDICVTGIAETDIWQLLSPVVTYRCVLTGAADGLPDIVIPISSFQSRKTVS